MARVVVVVVVVVAAAVAVAVVVADAVVAAVDVVDSGTWTDSGKGLLGRGFCDASAPAPKLARVGVAASSSGFGV